MSKSNRFPLLLKNGVEAMDMKSLIEHYDADDVERYFLSGRLENWLFDRYYEEEGEAVANLDKDAPDLADRLHAIFGIPSEMDAEDDAWRRERLARLQQFTDDETVLQHVDAVAFDQVELAELYDKDVDEIFLCEGDFRIPKSKQNLRYVLIGEPTVTGLTKSEQQAAKESGNESSLYPVISDVATKLKELLESNEPLVYAHASLNRSMSCMNYTDDQIHSRHEAERKAESIFDGIYSHAQDYFSTSSSHSLSDVAEEKLYGLVKPLFIELNDGLENLDDDVKSKNKHLMQELAESLDLKSAKQQIRTIAQKEIEDTYYQLSDVSAYTCQIEYSSMDHDPPGLFGKQDWWYNGMDAWMELDKDLRENTESYCKYVSGAFRREMLRPIMDLLERLK